MQIKIAVKTYSGYKADEYPKSFLMDNVRYTVMDIEDRWYDPDYSCFKVFADDGNRYILKNDAKTDEWYLMKCKAVQK
jgi:hypothetical protein